jgi:hypothetical protein
MMNSMEERKKPHTFLNKRKSIFQYVKICYSLKMYQHAWPKCQNIHNVGEKGTEANFASPQYLFPSYPEFCGGFCFEV